MPYYETTLTHTIWPLGYGGDIVNIAKLFKSTVFLTYQKRQLNLKWLGREDLKKGSEIALLVEGDDEEIAFPALVEALGTEESLYPIWNKHFTQKLNSGEVLKGFATILNELGLHNRAASRIVKLACSFESEILLGCGDMKVWATSITALLTLVAIKHQLIDIYTVGVHAKKALDAMLSLINNKFNEYH